MKFIKIILLLLLFNSCASSSYYQLFVTESNDVKTTTEAIMVYENDDLKLLYDFWDKNGNSSFIIVNKTDSAMYVDLHKSHLILNNNSTTYFQNRTFTQSSSSSSSFENSTTKYYVNEFENLNSPDVITDIYGRKYTSSNGYAVTYIEEKVMIIPPNSAKFIDGFSINSTRYRNCDLWQYPKTKGIKSKEFNEENSPLSIKNIVSYRFNELNVSAIKTVENSFWVSKVTNYPQDDFRGYKNIEFCGEESYEKYIYYLYKQPDSFFIKYYHKSNDFAH